MFSYLRREPGFYKNLFWLALPIILQNLINNMLALADTFMVGGLGQNELAAVTLANNIFFVLTLMSFGIQSGTAVLISQYWGKGDTKTINRIIGLGLMVAGVLSTAFVTVVMCFPRQIMQLTTIDPILVDIGVEYLFTVAPAFLLNALALMLLGAFRSMENARIGLVVLTVSMATNTVLNYMLIFGNWGMPAMGVEGAALATVISRALEFTLTVLYAVFNKHFRFRISCMMRPGLVIARDFAKYALPVIVNETMWGLGFTLYPVIVGHMENAAYSVAAYTVALNVDRILSALFFGIGGASAVIIGKHLGHGGDGDDSEESYSMGKVLLTITAGTGLLCGVLLALLATFVFRPILPALFDMTPETAALTWILLLINSVNMPIRSANYAIVVGILRGGGDVKAAAVIDIGFLYFVGLPFALILGLVLDYGVIFVVLAILVEEVCKLSAALWRFKKRYWIKNVTRALS